MLNADGGKPEAAGPENGSKIRSKFIKADTADAEELYKLLRGSPCAQDALAICDAFRAEDFVQAEKIIREVKVKYDQRHRNTELAEDPKSDTRPQRIHRAVLELFNKLIPFLEKTNLVNRNKSPDSESAISSLTMPVHEDIQSAQANTTNISHKNISDALILKYKASSGARERYDTLREYFSTKRVGALSDLVPNGLYFLVLAKDSYFIRISSTTSVGDPVAIRLVISGQALKPLPLQTLLKLGLEKKLVALLPKSAAAATENNVENFDHDRHLNPSAFGVLMTALKDTKIFPDYAGISYIRDSEYVKGKYLKAQQSISTMSQKFEAAAAQRQAANNNFYRRVESGVEKISSAKLAARKAEDTRIDHIVGRARQKFSEINGALGIIINLSSKSSE